MERFRTRLREYLLPLCIVAIWGGMMWSRAILSMGMMAFVALAVLLSGVRNAWVTVRREAALLGMILLFLIPACTFFWSIDKKAWTDTVVLKAPLLMAPFALAGWRMVTPTGRRRMWRGILIISFIAVGETVLRYAMHTTDVNASYLRGAVMTVAMDDDHVRFGWALAVVYAYLLDQVMTTSVEDGWTRKVQLLALILLGVFLLLLSSRTGWLGLVIAHAWSFGQHRSWKKVRGFRVAVLLLPLLALPFIPSLVNRLRFTLWDFQHYSRGGYVQGLNDTPRIISWQAGLDLWKANPMTGSGAGDLVRDLQTWYPAHHPDMPVQEWLRPSNEWLYHCAMAGLPGFLLFVVALWLMLRRKSSSMVWKSASTLALVGFLYELGLESQHGVFLFAFTMIVVDATFVPCPSQQTYKR